MHEWNVSTLAYLRINARCISAVTIVFRFFLWELYKVLPSDYNLSMKNPCNIGTLILCEGPMESHVSMSGASKHSNSYTC